VTAATAGVQLAASDVGTVVYQSADSALVNTTSIAMLDRRGVKTPLIDRSLNWSGLSFSPDGHQLAFDSYEGGRTRDVQVYDRRNETMRRFTFDPADDVNPIWSPDGRRIVFASKRGNARGFYNLYWQNADGSGEAQRLTTADAHHIPGGWHPSGRFIAYHEIRVAGAGDLEILPVESDASGGLTAGTPRAFVDTPATEQSPMFSPDGRWIAYHSNETGRDEVYVRPFPGPGGRWQVSTEGGTYPAWSPSKPELMYASRDQQVMVVHYAATAETFRADRPIPWPGGALGPGQFRRFSVHPDGEQIAAGVIDSSPPDATVVVVLNLFDELKRLTAR
jgi:Tol biopolymer transport system component